MRVERDPQWNQLAGIFRAAGDGHYSLPSDILALHTACSQLEATPEPEAKTSEAVEGERLAHAVTEAARAGKPLPIDAGAVARARQSEQSAADLRTAYGTALVTLREELVGAISDSAEEIATAHLRRAHGAVMEQARKAGEVLDSAGIPDPDVDAALLRASDEARAAAVTLDGLCQRYAAVRDALRRLPLGAPAVDPGWFAEARATVAMLGGPERIQRQHVQPPAGLAAILPTGPRARLLYLSRPEVEGWLPTPAEQDARWREVFGTVTAGRMTPVLLTVS